MDDSLLDFWFALDVNRLLFTQRVKILRRKKDKVLFYHLCSFEKQTLHLIKWKRNSRAREDGEKHSNEGTHGWGAGAHWSGSAGLLLCPGYLMSPSPTGAGSATPLEAHPTPPPCSAPSLRPQPTSAALEINTASWLHSNPFPLTSF